MKSNGNKGIQDFAMTLPQSQLELEFVRLVFRPVVLHCICTHWNHLGISKY